MKQFRQNLNTNTDGDVVHGSVKPNKIKSLGECYCASCKVRAREAFFYDYESDSYSYDSVHYDFDEDDEGKN